MLYVGLMRRKRKKTTARQLWINQRLGIFKDDNWIEKYRLKVNRRYEPSTYPACPIPLTPDDELPHFAHSAYKSVDGY